jgi:hypothetical protein
VRSLIKRNRYCDEVQLANVCRVVLANVGRVVLANVGRVVLGE